MDDKLFNEICNAETLYAAWLRVKEKNTSGGIDTTTVNDYAVSVDKNIETIIQQLGSGTYIQQPYREVMIPKNETEKRRLGLLTVNDKIVQTAVSAVITPVLERSFLKVSYAYREGKGAVKAINQVRHLIKSEHYTWIASCDIDDFFDTIPHDPLFGKLSAYIHSPNTTELIRMFVCMGRVTKRHEWKGHKKGIPQGGVISPLLANFFLYPLDKMMVDHHYGFVRYADDFIILGRTESEARQAIQQGIEIITKQLGLSLNEGAKVTPVEAGFEFLGIYFNNGEIDLSERKQQRLISKMAQAAGTGQGIVTQKLRETIQGISAFYGQLVTQAKLELLDSALTDILALRYEALQLSKAKSILASEQIRSIRFLSNNYNLHKTEFINQKLGLNTKVKKTPKLNDKKPLIKCRNAVLVRKHEYQKLEASGFDLAISQPGIVLGLTEKRVTVRKKGIILQEIALLNLKNITILSDGVSLSSNLIRECALNKISIDFLGRNGKPYAILFSPIFNDAQIGLAQLAAYTNNKAFELIKQFVLGKMNNQKNLIKYFGKYHFKRNCKFSNLFNKFIEKMDKYELACQSLKDDTLDEFRLKMFAIEGQASARYWEMVQALIQSKYEFNGREHQGATDLVNCMLNYGYGILYARIAETLIKARLNPCLSYLHKPEPDRPSLVYDLIEEFRQQAVDRVIIALVIKSKDLHSENGVLDEKTRKVVAQKVVDRLNNMEQFRKREMRLNEIIQHQANALAAYLTETTKTYKPYMPKW